MADPGTAGLALGGLGLVKDFMGQQDADKARGRALSIEEQKARLDAEQQRRLMDQWDKVSKVVDQARARGLYDPNGWSEQFSKDFNKNAKTIQDRNFANLTGRGYTPDSSEFKYRTDRLDRTLNHDLAVGQIDARQRAVAAETGALNSVNPGYLGTAASIGNDNGLESFYTSEANRLQPDWGASIQAILPFLMKNKGGSGSSGRYVNRDTGGYY